MSSGINLSIDGKEADVAAKMAYKIAAFKNRTYMNVCGQWNVPGDYNVSADNIGHSIDALAPDLQEKVRGGVDQVIDLWTNPTIVQANLPPLPTVIIMPPTPIFIQQPMTVIVPPAPIYFQPLPVFIAPPALPLTIFSPSLQQ